LVLTGLFVLRERRAGQPLVRLEAFRDRGFTISTLATLFASIAFISTFFFLSVYGQVSLQLAATETGLLFHPHGLACWNPKTTRHIPAAIVRPPSQSMLSR
ncbi:hypothetical protein ACC691_37945, partial [Rhizobium johnstonii]